MEKLLLTFSKSQIRLSTTLPCNQCVTQHNATHYQNEVKPQYNTQYNIYYIELYLPVLLVYIYSTILIRCVAKSVQ